MLLGARELARRGCVCPMVLRVNLMLCQYNGYTTADVFLMLKTPTDLRLCRRNAFTDVDVFVVAMFGEFRCRYNEHVQGPLLYLTVIKMSFVQPVSMVLSVLYLDDSRQRQEMAANKRPLLRLLCACYRVPTITLSLIYRNQ